MGILDTFKKAIGNRAENEADRTEVGAPGPAPIDVEEKTAEVEPTPVVIEPEKEQSGQDSYTVQSGDTLLSIAEAACGDGAKYMKIFEANSDLLEHPDQIIPGQKLQIPVLDD